MKAAFARLLVAAGRRARDRHLVLLDALVGYVALGRWLRRRGWRVPPRVPAREDVFTAAVDALGPGRLLYVELGVHEGRSLRWWAAAVPDPDARFVGFDSFEGLPEPWNPGAPRGHFATGGAVPEIEDPRVSLVPGWFEDTLPHWKPPGHERLFVTFDADLYSSTLTGLRAVRPCLVPGSWLYFDELNDAHHELRAFDEFLDESGLQVEPVVVAANLRQWLFRVRTS